MNLANLLIAASYGIPILAIILGSLEIGYFFWHKSLMKSRTSLWLIITLSILLFLSAQLYYIQYPRPLTNNSSPVGASDYSWLYVVGIILIYVVVIVISSMAYQKSNRQYQQQIKDLDRDNQQLLQDISRHVGFDVYGPIQIQLNEMKGYFVFAKREATVSSIISTASLIIGLGLMVIFVIDAFFFKSTDMPIAYATGLLGAVQSLIGGLVLTFHARASKKMDRYFEALNKIQRAMLAIELTSKYSDEDKRQQAVDRIIDSLIEEKTSEKKSDEKKP